jgi:periplasmic protein TonB
MDTNKILSADLLDLIFDDRNKAYGAYDLRKTYNHRIRKALLITASVAGLIIAGATIASSMKPPKKDLDIHDVTVMTITEELPPELPQPEPERLPEPEPVQTEQYTTPQIVEDNQVEEPPPTQDDLDKAKIDDFTQKGVEDVGITEPIKPGEGTGIIEDKATKEPEIWEKVEIDAKFSGNWETFLRRNLNANVPVDNGAPAGKYKVAVKFVVDVDGTVSDITPLTNAGFGMEQEAVRVLKKAAKWEPAFQNNKHVKAYRIQNITFEVLTDE